jgi:two-component system CheB/CheR fusion protein
LSAEDVDEKFEVLLDYLRSSRGFDFTGYKRISLKRRVKKRMQMLKIDAFGDYNDYLQVHPEEFSELFNTILINVTAFFRDPPAWDYLAQDIIPKIILGKDEKDPIRVWSAGCASGEEPYSTAILLAEALGPEAFRKRVKIYATDIDEAALAQARQAAYSAKDLEQVPQELQDKYFESSGDRYVFRGDLRRCVIFGRHDLISDAPISRLDLLICRNTLMYFNSETQAKVVAHFHFALNDDGFLFMGRSELLLTHASLFTPISTKHRVFTRVSKVNLRDRLLALAQVANHETSSQINKTLRLRDAALEISPLGHVVVDLEGNLVMANDQARTLFKLGSMDLGRPVQDLELSYRPVEVRSLIEKAYAKRRPVIQREVEKPKPDGSVQYFDVRVIPLQENEDVFGVSITSKT